MSKYLERAKELRAIVEPHYNCAQSVLLPFAEDLGLSEEKAFQIASHFGGGMKMGSVCGAVTGALMALGLAGIGDVPTAQEVYRHMRENHDGMLECRDLLRANAQLGREKKPHCDAMVYELVQLTEEIMERKKKEQEQ